MATKKTFTVVLLDQYLTDSVMHVKACDGEEAIEELWRREEWDDDERYVLATFEGEHFDLMVGLDRRFKKVT